jgi:hypothetical protein
VQMNLVLCLVVLHDLVRHRVHRGHRIRATLRAVPGVIVSSINQVSFLLSRPCSRHHHTTKTHVIARRGRLPLAPRPHHVPRTILVRANERTATVNALRRPGFLRIKTISRSARIARQPIAGNLCVIVRPVPVRAPFPHVPCKIVNPVPIRRIRRHDRRLATRPLHRHLWHQRLLSEVRQFRHGGGAWYGLVRQRQYVDREQPKHHRWHDLRPDVRRANADQRDGSELLRP